MRPIIATPNAFAFGSCALEISQEAKKGKDQLDLASAFDNSRRLQREAVNHPSERAWRLSPTRRRRPAMIDERVDLALFRAPVARGQALRFGQAVTTASVIGRRAKNTSSQQAERGSAVAPRPDAKTARRRDAKARALLKKRVQPFGGRVRSSGIGQPTNTPRKTDGDGEDAQRAGPPSPSNHEAMRRSDHLGFLEGKSRWRSCDGRTAHDATWLAEDLRRPRSGRAIQKVRRRC